MEYDIPLGKVRHTPSAAFPAVACHSDVLCSWIEDRLSCHVLGKCCTESYRRDWTRMLHQEAFVIIATIRIVCQWGNPLVRVWPVSAKDDAVLVQRWGPCSAAFAHEVLSHTRVEHVRSWIKSAWHSSNSLCRYGGAHSIWAPSCGSSKMYQRRTMQAQLRSAAAEEDATQPALFSSARKREPPTPSPVCGEGDPISAPLRVKRHTAV